MIQYIMDDEGVCVLAAPMLQRMRSCQLPTQVKQLKTLTCTASSCKSKTGKTAESVFSDNECAQAIDCVPATTKHQY